MSRVVHIVSHIGTYGGERFVAALARAQRAAGTDVAILTIYDSPAVPGVEVYSAGRRATYAPGGGFRFFFRLVRLLRRLRPDLVHTHLAHAKYWGKLAAVGAGVPHIVHTEHGNNFSASPLRRALARRLQTRTDRVVALTRAQAQRIERYEGVPAERVAVIPNGVEPCTASRNRNWAREALGVSAGSRAILFVGRLDPVKAPLRAVDALALLPRELTAHLYFIGEGRLRAALQQRARALGLNERVHLLGYRDDAGALLRGADVVLNTSDSEAMPLSLIEAISAGLPVVTTPWPGSHELLGDAGCMAAAFDAVAIAQELQTALRRKAATAEAIAALRDRFSITRAASQYLALYEEVLAPDRVRRASPIPGTPELSGLPQ